MLVPPSSAPPFGGATRMTSVMLVAPSAPPFGGATRMTSVMLVH